MVMVSMITLGMIVLWIQQFFNRIKIILGLAKEQYGMCNPFRYKGLLFYPGMHSVERLKASETFDKFRPDDVVVATYPKSGTHFVMEVVGSIYREKGLIAKNCKALQIMGPLEMNPPKFFKKASKEGTDEILAGLEDSPGPRIVMSHLHWNLLPPKIREDKVKVINCSRNPKDVMCSMFAFLKKMGVLAQSTTMRDFVQWYIEGNVLDGSYFDYLREWYPYRNNSNVLNLQFEDMKKDLRGSVKKIAEFLNIELSYQQLEAVAVANTFANVKKEQGRLHPIYRKGKSGGWKSEITVEQNGMLDEWTQQEMKGMEDLQIRYE